jgi:hypothetical protein
VAATTRWPPTVAPSGTAPSASRAATSAATSAALTRDGSTWRRHTSAPVPSAATLLSAPSRTASTVGERRLLAELDEEVHGPAPRTGAPAPSRCRTRPRRTSAARVHQLGLALLLEQGQRLDHHVVVLPPAAHLGTDEGVERRRAHEHVAVAGERAGRVGEDAGARRR